jgi:hypothetical protein
MQTLVELDNCGVRYLTDKAISHGYLQKYEEWFLPFRDKVINIFEVGYWYGGSCELWKRYFPKAYIRAIDIVKPKPKIRRVNGKHLLSNFIEPSNRVRLDFISINDLPPSYFWDFSPDIAIDDGSHSLSDQIRFIKLVYPVLHKGGILIIEDVQNIDLDKQAFDNIGIPYKIFDFRAKTNCGDSVLLLFKK